MEEESALLKFIASKRVILRDDGDRSDLRHDPTRTRRIDDSLRVEQTHARAI